MIKDKDQPFPIIQVLLATQFPQAIHEKVLRSLLVLLLLNTHFLLQPNQQMN